jgi:hypothetical protein
MSLARVTSQICHGISQNDRCSTNSACGCLRMAGAGDAGICGFLYGPCSELVSCESTNNACYEPNHICVHHPRCYLHPVCYPVSMIDQRICPPLSSKRNEIVSSHEQYLLVLKTQSTAVLSSKT